MKIKNVTWSYRNDYKAVMECEHCSAEQIDPNGYDDANYHLKVIPAMICKACGKRSVEPPSGRSVPSSRPPPRVAR